MRKYDEEFKREAVRKIFEGQSVASVAMPFRRKPKTYRFSLGPSALSV